MWNPTSSNRLPQIRRWKPAGSFQILATKLELAHGDRIEIGVKTPALSSVSWTLATSLRSS